MATPVSNFESDHRGPANVAQGDIGEPKAAVQSLCRLAADIADAEFALVSVMDDAGPEILACVGRDEVSALPRGIANSLQALMRGDQIVVDDTANDDRFRGSSSNTQDIHIKAFAGSSLEPSDGLRIGTLCVLDRHPRSFSPTVLSQLNVIAKAITGMLLARRDQQRLNTSLQDSKRRERHIAKAAQIDPMTGLFNSAYFRMHVYERLVKAKGACAFVIMDADRFKQVNDFYGHVFGDEYLTEIAAALQDSIPDHALLGRLGGDEFGLFIDGPDACPEAVQKLLEACLNTIQSRTTDADKPDLGGVSFGVSTYPDHAKDFQDLYITADVALYASKSTGRNRITFYTDRLGEQRNLRQLRADFLSSLKAGQIFPYYQPKIDLFTGAVLGFEALCRWHHPDRGLLTPLSFRPLLQDFKTAPEITAEVLRQVCADYQLIKDCEQNPGRIAVNFTVYDLQKSECIQDFDFYLAQAQLQWSDLIIEVTEHVVLGDDDGLIYQNLHAFRERGAHIALDDFGTGYGGLHHLKSWPVDMIKIDENFVAELLNSPENNAIVSAIIALAQALDIEVVAEGVETKEQAQALRDLGCTQAQGYYFGHPMPADQVLSFLENQSVA